jgi:hypothetical protein
VRPQGGPLRPSYKFALRQRPSLISTILGLRSRTKGGASLDFPSPGISDSPRPHITAIVTKIAAPSPL